jgi:hypothetical protein
MLQVPVLTSMLMHKLDSNLEEGTTITNSPKSHVKHKIINLTSNFIVLPNLEVICCWHQVSTTRHHMDAFCPMRALLVITHSCMGGGGATMRLLASQIWIVPHPWALPIGNHESYVIMDLNINRSICIRWEGLLGLCVFIGIRSLPLLRNRHKKPPLISGVILTEVRCPLNTLGNFSKCFKCIHKNSLIFSVDISLPIYRQHILLWFIIPNWTIQGLDWYGFMVEE